MINDPKTLWFFNHLSRFFSLKIFFIFSKCFFFLLFKCKVPFCFVFLKFIFANISFTVLIVIGLQYNDWTLEFLFFNFFVPSLSSLFKPFFSGPLPLSHPFWHCLSARSVNFLRCNHHQIVHCDDVVVVVAAAGTMTIHHFAN